MRGKIRSRQVCPACGAKGKYKVKDFGRGRQVLLCECGGHISDRPEIRLFWGGQEYIITHALIVAGPDTIIEANPEEVKTPSSRCSPTARCCSGPRPSRGSRCPAWPALPIRAAAARPPPPAVEDQGLLDGLWGLLGDIIPGLGDVLGGGIFDNLLKLLGEIDIGKLTSADKAKFTEGMKSLTAMQTAAQVDTQAKTGGVGGPVEVPEAEE